MILYSKIAIFTTIGAVLAQNIANLIFARVLVNASYNFTLSATMLLALCLVLIFSKILIKAIEINEENKMVI